MTRETPEYFSADFDNSSYTIQQVVDDQLRPSSDVLGYFDISRIVDSLGEGETIEPNVNADQYETQMQKLKRLTKFTGDVQTLLANTDLVRPTTEDYDELLTVTHDIARGEVSPREQLAEWLHNPSRFLSEILFNSKIIREGLDESKKDDVHPTTSGSMYFKTDESQATKVTWFNRFGGAPDIGERGSINRKQWAQYKILRQAVATPMMRILSYDVDMKAPIARVQASGISVNRDGKIVPIQAHGYPLVSNVEGSWALPFVSINERSVLPLIDEGNRLANAALAHKGIGELTVSESTRSASASSALETVRQLTPDNLLLAIPMGRMITRGELADLLPSMTPESYADIERATSSIANKYRRY